VPIASAIAAANCAKTSAARSRLVPLATDGWLWFITVAGS
jgi:hypothetical protein